jgi:hypothetical protein
MRTRSTRVAWSMLAVFAVGYGAAPLSVANGNFQRQPGFYLAMVLAFTAFMVVGAVIVAHRPGNPIGWIFSAVGLLSSAAVLGMEYAEYAYVTRPGSLPGAGLTAWLAVWSWFPLLGLILVFTPLLFPTGRLLSARWRPVAVAAAVGIAAFTVLVALQPTIRLQNEDYTVRNPIGLAGVPDPEGGGVMGAVLTGLLFGCLAAAVASVVLRFRSARGDERQQLKWLCMAGAILVAQGIGDTVVFVDAGDVSQLVSTAIFALVPVAIGIAMLRYRLYDIDLVINRTLVYGALTAMLAAAYFVIVVALQNVIPGAGDSDLTIAGSTLAVAALFRPLRSRVQGFIDRRFYRRKYDAQRTLESFSSRLREDVDLDHLSADLLRVVHDTMQPAHASLWLRTEGVSR